MARVKFGDGVSGQTGSLNKQAGGVTYLKNNVKRMRVIPTNPRTEYQAIVRGAFSYLTSAWLTLTDEQRAEWEAARSLPQWAVSDAFYGVSKPANSAKSLFIFVNYNLLQSVDELNVPSVQTNVPPASSSNDSIGGVDVAVDASSDSVTLTYSGSLSAETLVLRATPAVSPGNMRIASVASKLRDCDASDAASPATINHPGTKYTGQANQKVFWILQAINLTTGLKRVVATGTTIITT